MARTLFPTLHMPEEQKKTLICIIKSRQAKRKKVRLQDFFADLVRMKTDHSLSCDTRSGHNQTLETGASSVPQTAVTLTTQH